MKNKLSGSLYRTMLTMVVLPMAVLGIIVMIFCALQYEKILYKEVETGLENTCKLTLAAFDEIYHGDYSLVARTQAWLLKGDRVLNGNFRIIDRIKYETGIDITIFYYDTRVLTTITDKEGKRIVGTGSNAIVMQEVYEKQQPKFFEKVDINGEDYFSYYMPIMNSKGECVGMVFAGKPSEDVIRATRESMVPIIVVITVMLVLFGAICLSWAKKTITHIQFVQNFMTSMAEGSFSKEMNPALLKRNDEIGRMGKASVQMQSALRNLVEKDVLTELNNRRFGAKKLAETKKLAEKTGIPFAIALGDIDYFKKVNDTYGHDVGDHVLIQVAKVLRKHMQGKGFAIRWGGEEFLLVFHEMGIEQAVTCTWNILEEIRRLEITVGENKICPTLSFGIAEGCCDKEINALVKDADDKLYYAKANGRNQVVDELPQEDEQDGVEETSL